MAALADSRTIAVPGEPVRWRRMSGSELAGGLGFEPRLAESESAVLPLDDPPTGNSKLARCYIDLAEESVNGAE